MISAFQVRKSFFNDLDIQNNVTIVDLLYEQFYTGSEAEPSKREQDFMKVQEQFVFQYKLINQLYVQQPTSHCSVVP